MHDRLDERDDIFLLKIVAYENFFSVHSFFDGRHMFDYKHQIFISIFSASPWRHSLMPVSSTTLCKIVQLCPILMIVFTCLKEYLYVPSYYECLELFCCWRWGFFSFCTLTKRIFILFHWIFLFHEKENFSLPLPLKIIFFFVLCTS